MPPAESFIDRPGTSASHGDTASEAADSAGLARSVAAEQVRLLYAQARGGLLINLLVSAFLGALLWETSVRPRVLPWFVAMVIVLVGRAGALVSFHWARLPEHRPQFWRRVFVIGSTAQGALWGLCGVFLFPTGHPEHQFFLILVLSGMAGGAVAYLFPVWNAFVLFGVFALFPPSLRILWEATPVHVAVGLCGLVFLAGMLFAAHRSHQWLTEALYLGFEKQRLAERIVSAMEETARASREYGHELTERLRAERAQREAYERYRLVLEASPDPIAVRDDAGRITYLNPAFEKVFGWSLEDFAQGDTEFIPASEQRGGEEAWARMRAGDSVVLETRRMARDGNSVEVEVNGAPFRPSEGAPAAGAIEIYRDVTRQKQATQELREYREHLESLVQQRTAELEGTARELEQEVAERRQAEEALARSEREYRHFVENIDDVIYASDSKGCITYISPAITALAGYDPSHVVGHRVDEFVHPADLAASTTAFLNTLHGGKNVIEFRILTASGEPRWVRSSGTPIHGKTGRTGVQGVITDLHDIKQAEEHRRALEVRLLHAQRMEAMGTLAGGVAHEFRNLLQVIRGHAELALLSAKAEGTTRSQMRRLLTAVDRGADLTGKLLTFSRRASGQEQVADLRQVVMTLGGVLGRVLPRNVVVSVAPIPTPLPVRGDPAQIEQVLVNLALNARDAMPEGGRLLISGATVSVEDESTTHPSDLRAGRYACLEVSDTGYGMEAETVQRVFDPFFTTKEVGHGTGLGLSIAYSIIRGHGGTITCESNPGIGTLFRIYLPLDSTAPAEPSRPRPADQPTATGHAGDETILLVEDERSVREVTADFLESCGYEVLRAGGGEEALALFQAAGAEIDVVLLDLGMRGMGGRSALKTLAGAAPGLPIIVATGYAVEGAAAELKDWGVRRVIAKPYGLPEIAQAIRTVLDEEREDSPTS